MIRLETECLLKASPLQVWTVLTNFTAIPEWNPFIRSVQGEPVLGARLSMRVAAPDGSGREYNVRGRVVALEPKQVLAWKGGVPGILTGLHYWKLASDSAGTRLVHGEEFYGLYPLVAGERRILALTSSYETMNQGLAAYLSLAEPVA